MVERLLIDRVGLVLRREIREAPAYALKMVGAAPRFTPPPLERSQLEIWKRQWDTNNMLVGRSVGEPGGYSGKDVYMKDVVELLAGIPDIFTALEQQVGLRLEETTAKTEFWVIESISRPTEN